MAADAQETPGAGETPASRSAAEILDHPRFEAARLVFLERQLDLLVDRDTSRLLMSAQNNVAFTALICLHATYREDDRGTWPTLTRLKDMVEVMGLGGRRTVDDYVSRLRHTGYVEATPARGDGRVKLLRPTARMLALDRAYGEALLAPLGVMFGTAAYPPDLLADLAFHLAFRRVGATLMDNVPDIVARHPAIFRLGSRHAGSPVLIILLHKVVTGDSDRVDLSFSEIGERIGVSRTHVRAVVQEAADHGLLTLDRQGRAVVATPALRQRYDGFLADLLATQDLILKRVAATRP